VISPRARRELAEIVEWIAQDNPQAAVAFRSEVEKVARRIGNHPRIGRFRPELARGPYRFIRIAGYPYLIVYREDDMPPPVVRVVHMARDLPTVLSDLR